MRVQITTILDLKTVSSLARLTDPFSQQGSRLSDQQWCVWCCARSTGRAFLQGRISQCKKHRHSITVQKDMLQYDKMENDEPLCACGPDFSPVFGQYRSDFTGSSSSCCEANHRNVKCSLSSTTVHPLSMSATTTDHSVWVFGLNWAKTLKWEILHVKGVVYPLHNYIQVIEFQSETCDWK